MEGATFVARASSLSISIERQAASSMILRLPKSCFRPLTQASAAEANRALEFEHWLKGLGHDKCGLHLHRFPQGSATPRYGVTAGAGGVEKGQVVVKVPFQAFMSEESAGRCPHIGPLIKSAALTSWQIMCLHLLFERARGAQSPWHAYIAMLPKEEDMASLHPLLWPQGLCDEWLAGSPLLERMKARLDQCRADFEAIHASGASRLASVCLAEEFVLTEERVRWAAAILLSRAFSLDLNEEELDEKIESGHSTVLVPWADMLNHSSMAGKASCLRYDSDTGLAFLKAHRNYTEGEQVFDSYGPWLSVSQLFLDYGFVDDETKIQSIDLPAVHLGPVRDKLNEVLLNFIGLPPDGAMFSISGSGVDRSVLTWTRVAAASYKELKDAGWNEPQGSDWEYKRAASCMAHFHRPVSHQNESEVLKRLLLACETVLTRYPTNLEDELAFLTTSDYIEQHPMLWSRKQVLRVLIAEKAALRGAWKLVYSLSKKLNSGVHYSLLYIKPKTKTI